MFLWERYPLIRILLPLIAGILLTCYGEIPLPIGGLFLVSLLFLLILAVLSRDESTQNERIGSSLAFGAIFLLSICLTSIYIQLRQPPKELYQADYQILSLTIVEPPVEKNKSMKLVVAINQFVHNDSLKPCHTKAMLYFAKDEQSKSLVYGDRLLCRTLLAGPPSPQNPHEFHYRNYLNRKGIYLQGYVHANAWEATGKKGGSVVFRIANRMRNKFLAIFAAADMNPSELGVISAILLGSDDKLEPELVQSYAATGVSHILCVSGMHVGIIYMILSFFLRFLDKNKQQRAIRSLILLLTIWLYACITGLFPSVVRAATMFTFVAFSGLMGKKTNSYSSLLASLLFLLLLNPLLIFQVGFQFSYCAVFGILWLQKPIRSLYNPLTKAGNHAWEIISVSLAAQLLLSPLSLLYFHQFPNYFLLSNIVVVSLAPIVVGGGIAVLAVSFWEFAYRWVSLGLVYIIKTMNWLVVQVESLPYSLTENIHISIGQTVWLYGLILTFSYAFLYKNKVALSLSLFFAIGIAAMGVHKQHQTHSQQMLLFYHTKSGCIVDCIDGKTSSLFGDSAAVFDKEIYRYNISNNHIHHQIRSVKKFQNQQFISFHGKTVFFLSQPLHPHTDDKIKVDYLVLTHKNIPIEKIKNTFDFQLLILDSTLPHYKRKQLKDACEKEGIAYHDLKDEGAMVKMFGF